MLMAMKNRALHIFIFTCISLLAGCGGGGDSSTQPAGNPNNDAGIAGSANDRLYDIGILSLQTLIPVANFPHASHIPLGDAPYDGMLLVSARFLEKPADIQIYVVWSDNEQETLVELDPRSMNDENAYVGAFAPPTGDFKFKLVGVTQSGESFILEVPKQFQ